MSSPLRSPVVAMLLFGVPLSSVAGQRKAPETGPATFSMAKEYRAVQLSALQSQRKLLVSFADSMPERLYRDKATPAQRDFAQQIHHVVSSSAFVANMFVTGQSWKDPIDSAQVYNHREALKQYINQRYDELDAMMKGQTDADRDLHVKFFNGQMLPRWQIWDELNQHAVWTAGQVVANFRKNGMAPPAFLFF